MVLLQFYYNHTEIPTINYYTLYIYTHWKREGKPNYRALILQNT